MIRSLVLRLPCLLLLAAPLVLSGCGNSEDDLLPVIEGVNSPNAANESITSYEERQAQQQRSMYKPGGPSGYPRPKTR